MNILIATNNDHKLLEYKKILNDNLDIKCLKDFSINIDPTENGNTLLENAFIKARSIYDTLLNKGLISKDYIVVSDDTGLFIEYLENGPGVYSARFLDPLPQSKKNELIISLLSDIKEIEERKAYFKTVIYLISNDINIAFEGRVDGYISYKISGNKGFGYDSIFIPKLYKDKGLTYADLGEEKNKISHRYIAINKLLKYLEERSVE